MLLLFAMISSQSFSEKNYERQIEIIKKGRQINQLKKSKPIGTFQLNNDYAKQ
jgi:hypothetical protein